MIAANNIYIVAHHKGGRERSVDILSLSGEFTRSYLDKIMPGISVLTTRFRYMSFICWAISEKIDPRSEEFRLIEDALAKTQYKVGQQGKHVGFYKGSRNIVDAEPHYYVQSVFGDYRRTMQGFNLISSDNTFMTNGKGKHLSECFKKSIGEKPKNLSSAAYNGFPGAKKSLLSLSAMEKETYLSLFYSGGDTQAAKLRKKYSPLYKKLAKRVHIQNEDTIDSTPIDLLKEMRVNMNLESSYPLALAMFCYIDVVYCFTKALHELHSHLSIKKRISLSEAAALPIVKKHLTAGIQYKDGIFWHAAVPELKGLLSARNNMDLLRRLLRRLKVKDERAWLVAETDYVKINPLNPPVPKDVRPYGFRLTPFSKLMSDL
jgi:hypothetical protein